MAGLIRRLSRDEHFGAAILAAPLFWAARFVLIHVLHKTGFVLLLKRQEICVRYGRLVHRLSELGRI